MGCGEVANYGHIPAILETPGLELQSIYDPNPLTLQKTQERYRIPCAFTETDRFFSSGLDAVTITSPAPVHHQNVMEAAHHRLPVLCEKPLATNRIAAQEMLAAMQQAQASLCCLVFFGRGDGAEENPCCSEKELDRCRRVTEDQINQIKKDYDAGNLNK